MEEVTFDESKRIKPPSRMARVKSYARGWALALIVGGGAVAIAHVNGIDPEKVMVYAIVAALLEEPLAWGWIALTDGAVELQQEGERKGNVEVFESAHRSKTVIDTLLLVFKYLFWMPLRWGIVYATALGWL